MKTAEKFVLRQIMDYLAARHVFHVRLNTAAIRAEHNGKQRYFRTHSLGPGTADILVLPAGEEPIWIECKADWDQARQRFSNQLSEAQKIFASWVETYGHRYIVVHSIDDLKGLI